MKRQPIALAAVFFVLVLLLVESHSTVGDSVGMGMAATDCIFRPPVLY